MSINPAGEQDLELNLEHDMDIHDVKQLASEMCNVFPDHMRVPYKDKISRNEETVGLDA